MALDPDCIRRSGTRLAAALAILAAGVLGCSRTHEPARADRSRPLIGVALLTRTHAFYKDLEKAMRETAAERNLDLTVVSCEMDPVKQASQLEDFVTQRVDAILAAPCDSSAVVPYIDKAVQARIPVFTVDIAARGGTVVSHVASDNEAGGRLAAQTLAALLNGSGDVIIIDHPEVASVQDRTRGFRDALKNFPNVNVVQTPSANGQRARAMTVMEDMLQAHRQLRGVFAINDDSALGALSVLEAAKRTDVVIVGFDATDEAKAAIRRNSALKADIAQHPVDIGKSAIDVVARHLRGESTPAVIAVPVTVVDARTLANEPSSGPAGR